MRKYIVSEHSNVHVIGYTDDFIEPVTHYNNYGFKTQPGSVQFKKIYYMKYSNKVLNPKEIKSRPWMIPFDNITKDKREVIEKIFLMVIKSE